MSCLSVLKLPHVQELNLLYHDCSAAALRCKRSNDEWLVKLRGTVMEDDSMKVVCVTGGTSFLSVAIINRLLSRGLLQETERLKELQESQAIVATSDRFAITPVVADLTEVDSLTEAFNGCYGVFHTGEFVDPFDLSGYTKSMAELEVKITETVMEACSRASSVMKCLLSSSLLACIWRPESNDVSPIIDHLSWSDEAYCRDKKLWYALGKLKSATAAWRIAREKDLRLATICSALPTGSGFHKLNVTATFGYLKGVNEMFWRGMLATVEVKKLADAHVSVYEAKTAHGRYVCYDSILQERDEVEGLVRDIGMPRGRLCRDTIVYCPRARLSNSKLSALTRQRDHRCVVKRPFGLR